MGYVNVDENLPDHRKVLGIPREHRASSMWLFVQAVCYCSRHLTDGLVPAAFFEGKEVELECLSSSALVHQEDSGSVRVHDYLDWNRSRAEVEEYIEKRKTAGRKAGIASGRARAERIVDQSFDNRSTKTNTEAEAKHINPLVGESQNPNKETIAATIAYLNSKAGTDFRPTTAGTVRHLGARIKEGYGLDDFKSVIDKKCAAWLPDPRMRIYLRPDTLFCGKFEGYVNERSVDNEPDPLAGKWLA